MNSSINPFTRGYHDFDIQRRTRHVGVRHGCMAMLFDLQGMRPALLHGITQTVQRTHPWIPSPGESQFSCAAGTDQQVVNQIRGHAYQVQIFLVLPDELMGRSCRNQMGKAFEGDGVAIVDEAFDGFAQRKNFSHGGSRLSARRGSTPGGRKVPLTQITINPIIDYQFDNRTLQFQEPQNDSARLNRALWLDSITLRRRG